MMRDNENNGMARQVHFANGFPPKGLVNTVKRGQQPYKLPGRRYVSLDEVSPRLGRSHRTIPPLAKGRGQFCSTKDRPADDRYKRIPDPFHKHKAAEKTGFSASPIRHARPRIRACHSSEPPSPPPATSVVHNLKSLARRTAYSTPPTRPSENDVEEDMLSTSLELRSRNSRIVSDVEKESIQAELAGLEEVYHRVCHGKVESLYSLLYPRRKDVKRGPVQYIKTSAPLLLRSPRNIQPSKEKSDAKAVESNATEKTSSEAARQAFLPSGADDAIQEPKENTSRPILIPLPYIRSDTGVAAVTKQQKPAYSVPLVYGSRTATKPLHGHATPSTATPAVINFNPMDIPELVRPGTKNGQPTGSIVGVQSKNNTGTVAIVADTVTPPNNSAQSVNKNGSQESSIADAESKSVPGNLDLESVGSEFGDPGEGFSGNVASTSEKPVHEKSGEDEDPGESSSGEDIRKVIVAQGIRLSITTDDGRAGGVEIYDYEKRDIEGERFALKQIEELEEIGEKKMKEIEELLEDHQHILDEVNKLEKELKDTH